MAEPYVPVARYTTAEALMTVLETAINTIDDDVEAIISDKNAALVAATSNQKLEKEVQFGFLLGGG
jgi:hypothetical protein